MGNTPLCISFDKLRRLTFFPGFKQGAQPQIPTWCQAFVIPNKPRVLNSSASLILTILVPIPDGSSPGGFIPPLTSLFLMFYLQSLELMILFVNKVRSFECLINFIINLYGLLGELIEIIMWIKNTQRIIATKGNTNVKVHALIQKTLLLFCAYLNLNIIP